MRIALISDVHANAEALDAVLRSLDAEGVKTVISLGDVVGYNAFPSQAIARLRERGIPGVVGNHDLMVTGAISPTVCGPRGRRVAEWTARLLSPEEMMYLGGLPTHLLPVPHAICVHSALGSCTRRLRLPGDFREERAVIGERFPDVRICFTGHTHEQVAVEVRPDGSVNMWLTARITASPDAFWFINPGTVGEPRETDQRAAYAVYDADTGGVTFQRVAYQRSRVLAENRRQGLYGPPPSLGARMRALVRSVGELVRP